MVTDSRQPIRSSVSIWRNLTTAKAIRAAFEQMSGYHRVEDRHARFQISSFEQDRSCSIVRSNQIDDGRTEFVYEIDVYSISPGIFVLSGRHAIAREVYSQLASHYERLFHVGFALVSVDIDLRKLVADHHSQLVKLHVQLNNTDGVTALTAYGDDIVSSQVYRSVLESATFVSATLRAPFEIDHISMTFNRRGYLSSETLVPQSSLETIVRSVVDAYSTSRTR